MNQLEKVSLESSKVITTLREATRQAVKYAPTEAAMLTALVELEDAIQFLSERAQDQENCISAIVKNIHEVAYNDERQRSDDLSKIIRQYDCYPTDES